MSGHDLEMSCAKFQRNHFRKIDGKIDENHTLQIKNLCHRLCPLPYEYEEILEDIIKTVWT